MNVNNCISKVFSFVNKHSSTILTCISSVGVAATSIMTAKATKEAVKLIDKAEKEKGKKLTKTESVKMVSRVYIPPIITGASTIACIFGANVLNKRKQASLISAYALLENRYKHYRATCKNICGVEADQEIIKHSAFDKYHPKEHKKDDGTMLFFDYYSDRYFESTMENVQRAEYELNKSLVKDDVVCINDWYELLGIDLIDGGDGIGWSIGYNMDSYWTTWIDFKHEYVTMDDNLECCIIVMSEPSIEYKDVCFGE